jgi:hypothetical protein
MSIEHRVNNELTRLKLSPLAADQIQCLHDPARLEEAAEMLAGLRDRSGLRLPMPSGTPLGGPFLQEDEAVDVGRRARAAFPVVAVDRMATDESRSTGIGEEYYVTGYTGADAAGALSLQEQWIVFWLRGQECRSDT